MVSSREGKLAADYAGAQEAWLLENAARWARKFVIGGGGHRGWQQQSKSSPCSSKSVQASARWAATSFCKRRRKLQRNRGSVGVCGLAGVKCLSGWPTHSLDFWIPILATALRDYDKLRDQATVHPKQVKKNHSPAHQQTASKPYQAYNL